MTIHTDDDVVSPLATTLETFFERKTACDLEATMSYFSPELVSYIDATLGWDFDSHAALHDVFARYMPRWAPPARSYATAVLANERSALVRMVDTPELWSAGPIASTLPGITALELDRDGLITAVTSVYDSRQLDQDHKAGLVSAAVAP